MRSRISLTALFALATILLIFRAPALTRNLGAVALLKCGLLTGASTQASACSSRDPWPALAPPLLRGVQAIFSDEAKFPVAATYSAAAYPSGDSRTALRLFEQARRARPSDPFAVFWLASATYRSGDRVGAVHSWKALGPRKMAAFFTIRAKAALDSGDPASALEMAQIALAVDPTCGEAALQLGRFYLQRGELEEGGSAFRKALQLDLNAGDRGFAYHALGEIDRSLGHDEQALGEYRRAIEFAPGAYLFRRDLADQYTRLRLYPEAQALLADLLMSDPSNASLLVRMGNLFLDQTQYAAAEQWYRTAVSAQPASGTGEAALGRLYRQKGDLDRAAAFFQKSIQLNPDNHWVSASLGGVYWQQGRLDDAIAAYAFVVERSKDRLLLEAARLSLARLYSITGKNPQAQPAPLYSTTRYPELSSTPELNPANPTAPDILPKNP